MKQENQILFDLTATQPIGSNKRHGGGKYGEVVLRQILKRGLPVTCYYDSNKWLKVSTQFRAIK